MEIDKQPSSNAHSSPSSSSMIGLMKTFLKFSRPSAFGSGSPSSSSSANGEASTINRRIDFPICGAANPRSEEHTSELQSRPHLVCRLLLEKKKIHDQLDGTCSPSSNHTRRRSVSIYDPPLHLSHSYLLPYCVDLHLQSMHQA